MKFPPFILSRRRFVRRSLVVGLALFVSSVFVSAERIAFDPHCWALVSDVHVPADPAKMARGINPTQQFTTVVQEMVALRPAPAGVLFCGDIAYNSGFPEDYAAFSRLARPLREAGIPMAIALGNHDHRTRFWEAFPEFKKVVSSLDDRQITIVKSERVNWFLIDSLDKTNSTPGVLGEEQLKWLAKALDEQADKPAIVMLHHNPRPPEKLSGALTETSAFLEILRARRHVKAYVFGHSHRWSVTKDPSGLHLVNLPTTAWVFDKTQPTGWVIAKLEPDGMKLELRAIDRKHKAHGEVHELKWRE